MAFFFDENGEKVTQVHDSVTLFSSQSKGPPGAHLIKCVKTGVYLRQFAAHAGAHLGPSWREDGWKRLPLAR